ISAILSMAGSMWRLLGVIWKQRIGMIHSWCTPAGAIGTVLSSISGVPLVVDSYEPHAEAMVENGTWPQNSFAFRLLFWLERKQTHHARHLIAAAEGMKEYARLKFGFKGEMFVKPAGVALGTFSKDKLKDPDLLQKLGLENKLIMVYAGKFGGIYLDQQVFDLFKCAKDHWGERFHVLLLTPHSLDELIPFIVNSGLDHSMFTILFVPHEQVPLYMGLADMALTPVKPVPTKKYCTPIKDGEYWALGLPVIITPNISDDSKIISDHGIGSIIGSLSSAGYNKAIQEMDQLLAGRSRKELYDMIRPIAEQYRSFGHAAKIYKQIYGEQA
ncbi:MAG: hypothetical protein M3R08_05845, partial [Bacteroidota bacterium]|nr:hypothetical protein [Bacteroidota bacterium]